MITELRLRVRPTPSASAYSEGWAFRSWAAGLAGLQRLARHDLLPNVVRLSDPDETRANLLMAGGAGARALRGTLKAPRRRGGRLHARGRLGGVADAGPRAVAGGGLGAPGEPGGAAGQPGRGVVAQAHRPFSAPYLRDRLLDAGLLVETVETAATWAALPTVYDAVPPGTARVPGPRRPGGPW